MAKDSWIIFNAHPHRNRRLLNILLRTFGAPDVIMGLRCSDLVKAPEITGDFAKGLLSNAEAFDLAGEKELIERHGVHLISAHDGEFPENLRMMQEPPPLIYIKGEFIQEDRYAVAVIGSRRHSSYGRLACQKIARDLAAKGITIVSGMARGIDTIAHQAALETGGRTIAVLGNGLASCYPPENQQLMEQIFLHGAVVSEYPMKAVPLKDHFPERNSIIAGMSLGICVVEATEKSGSLTTVRSAAENNRSLYAVPGNIFRHTCQGTNALIRDGAQLVRSADDILEDLSLVLRGMMKR